MAGTIYKRGERTWQVRIYLGRDPKTGKRINHNKTIHGTKKDAQRYLNSVLRDRDLGLVGDQTKLTLNEYLDKWLETSARHRVSATTFHDYQGILERYVRPRLGLKRLDKLVPLEIQELYTEMLGGGLSPRTIRYTHTVLNSALNQAVKWRMLVVNPASAVDLPRQTRNEMQFLTPDEIKRFLEAAAFTRWGILFTFALATGMRPSEMFGLMWRDIDWKKKTISVRRSLVRNPKGGGWSFSETKTSRSERPIIVPASLLRDLQQHHEHQAAEREKAGVNYEDYDLVFATRNGTPLDGHNILKRHFRPVLRAAGLPETLRLYDLRHSSATALLAAGEMPKVIGERLGHASVVLTLDVYSHVLPSMQQAAADKLEALLYDDPGDEPS